jgi:aryl-alcohol dehydrogenase-like predicted oxidoreductase
MERKNFLGLSISELGVGTYLGDLDQATSEGYKQVIRTAYKRGVNVVEGCSKNTTQLTHKSFKAKI